MTISAWLDVPGVITLSDITHAFIETHKPPQQSLDLIASPPRDTRLRLAIVPSLGETVVFRGGH
jgi:hypothetical protein